MQLPGSLMLSIAISSGLVGLMFLYLPQRIRPLEAWLNTPCGNREMVALRVGFDSEQTVEKIMNRVVLSRQVVWDDWLIEHPRLSGLVLCALAMWLVIQV